MATLKFYDCFPYGRDKVLLVLRTVDRDGHEWESTVRMTNAQARNLAHDLSTAERTRVATADH